MSASNDIFLRALLRLAAERLRLWATELSEKGTKIISCMLAYIKHSLAQWPILNSAHAFFLTSLPFTVLIKSKLDVAFVRCIGLIVNHHAKLEPCLLQA